VDSVGVIVLAVALVAATAFGLWRRRSDGRLRAVAASTRPSGVRRRAAAPSDETRFPTAALGIELGDRATLVQFSTAFCQPCRATRRVLLEVADMVDGVVAAEVDAEAHLDVVRDWGVMRTPTVFVLDPSGVVVQRASGQPRTVDVIASIGALDGEGSTPRSEHET
jgi:thiol-disulfide isomerase/thioredoxin